MNQMRVWAKELAGIIINTANELYSEFFAHMVLYEFKRQNKKHKFDMVEFICNINEAVRDSGFKINLDEGGEDGDTKKH